VTGSVVRIVKVFSATRSRDRATLGERMTEWLDANPGSRVLRTEVRQSSDSAFHCLSIVVFCDGGDVTST
jgi:hypothetical protein